MEIFNFGKYKGRKVSDIIKQDPEYVAWASRNVSWFTLEDSQRQLLDSVTDEVRPTSRVGVVNPDMRHWHDEGDYDPESMFGSHRLEIDTFGLCDYGDW